MYAHYEYDIDGGSITVKSYPGLGRLIDLSEICEAMESDKRAFIAAKLPMSKIYPNDVDLDAAEDICRMFPSGFSALKEAVKSNEKSDIKRVIDAVDGTQEMENLFFTRCKESLDAWVEYNESQDGCDSPKHINPTAIDIHLSGPDSSVMTIDLFNFLENIIQEKKRDYGEHELAEHFANEFEKLASRLRESHTQGD